MSTRSINQSLAQSAAIKIVEMLIADNVQLRNLPSTDIRFTEAIRNIAAKMCKAYDVTLQVACQNGGRD